MSGISKNLLAFAFAVAAMIALLLAQQIEIMLLCWIAALGHYLIAGQFSGRKEEREEVYVDA